MDRGAASRALGALVIVELVLFLIALPGFGIETRSFTQYQAWAGPVFLVLTLALFVSGIASLAWLRKNRSRSAGLAVLLALVALATVALDTSHVGGPPPPTGPFWLGIIGSVVALMIIVFARLVLQAEDHPPPPTPS